MTPQTVWYDMNDRTGRKASNPDPGVNTRQGEDPVGAPLSFYQPSYLVCISFSILPNAVVTTTIRLRLYGHSTGFGERLTGYQKSLRSH